MSGSRDYIHIGILLYVEVCLLKPSKQPVPGHVFSSLSVSTEINTWTEYLIMDWSMSWRLTRTQLPLLSLYTISCVHPFSSVNNGSRCPIRKPRLWKEDLRQLLRAGKLLEYISLETGCETGSFLCRSRSAHIRRKEYSTVRKIVSLLEQKS